MPVAMQERYSEVRGRKRGEAKQIVPLSITNHHLVFRRQHQPPFAPCKPQPQPELDYPGFSAAKLVVQRFNNG